MKLSIVDSLPPTIKKNSIALNINKGQRLFRKGDRAESTYLIKQGRFQEISYPDTGKVAVLQILNAGEALGEVSIHSHVYHSTAIAQTDAQVIAYPNYILLEALQEYPLLIDATVEILARKIDELRIRLEWRNISIADRRVLKYLEHKLARLSQDRENSPTFTLDAPLQEIAAELGFVPGTLSRALAKLEADHKITREQNKITLHTTDAA